VLNTSSSASNAMKVWRIIEPHLYDKLIQLMKQSNEPNEKPDIPKPKEQSEEKYEYPKHFQSFEDFVKQRQSTRKK